MQPALACARALTYAPSCEFGRQSKMQAFEKAERVLAAVAALGFFALNEARMFQALPRSPDEAAGHMHALNLTLLEATELVYASAVDLAVRWGLAGVTVGFCLWALAETLGPAKQEAGQGRRH